MSALVFTAQRSTAFAITAFAAGIRERARLLAVTPHRCETTWSTNSPLPSPADADGDAEARHAEHHEQHPTSNFSFGHATDFVQTIHHPPPVNGGSKRHADLRIEKLTKALLYDGGCASPKPAHTLDDALVDVIVWPRDDNVPELHGNIAEALKRELSAQSISVEEWLAFRNALLATTWSEARTAMDIIADEAWPGFVLSHAVTLVKVGHQATDALALFGSNVRRSSLTARSADVVFQTHGQTFLLLSDLILNKHRLLNHTHTLTRLLIDIFASIPLGSAIRSKDATAYDKCVLRHVQNLTRLADRRCRLAVLDILEHVEPRRPYRGSLHIRCIRTCLQSEPLQTPGKNATVSTRRFCNGIFMGKLLPMISPEHTNTSRWARLVAISVGGRERDHYMVSTNYRALLDLSREQDLTITPSWLLYLRAVMRARYNDPSLDAYVLKEIEEMLAKGITLDPTPKGSLRNRLTDILSQLHSVPVNDVLSLLRISSQDGPGKYTDIDFGSPAETVLSKPHAYCSVMSGLNERGAYATVPKVWKVMLERCVAPNAATFTGLITALFRMGKIEAASEQLTLWLDQGVIMPRKPQPFLLPDIVIVDLDSTDVAQELSVNDLSSTLASDETNRVCITPDTILTTVIFRNWEDFSGSAVNSLTPLLYRSLLQSPRATHVSSLLKMSCTRKNNVHSSQARDIFRALLFCKHPELKEFRNPVCNVINSRGVVNWLFSAESADDKVARWFMSFFAGDAPALPRFTPDTCDTSELVFDRDVFEDYVRLLLHAHHSSSSLSPNTGIQEELLNTLGYMKKLKIPPRYSTIALALLELEESLPPFLAVHHMSMITNWLTDWLGPTRLPNDQFMKDVFAWKMERNHQGEGWFEPYSADQFASLRKMRRKELPSIVDFLPKSQHRGAVRPLRNLRPSKKLSSGGMQ